MKDNHILGKYLADAINPDATSLVDVGGEELKAAYQRIEELENGIRAYLDGNYTHPRTFRAQGAQVTCSHGKHYYESCENCIDEHFQALLCEAIEPFPSCAPGV